MACAIDTKSENRSIYGLLLRIAFPLGLMALVMSVFCLLWLLRRYFSEGPSSKNVSAVILKSRLVVIFLVVVFFSYQSITKELMTIVNCIRLDFSEMDKAYAYDNSKINVTYSQYSIAHGLYWTEDTKIQCKKGAHALLAGILGIPGIVLFLCGIPLCLLIFLIFQRGKGGLTKLDILNTYGFMYQNYTDKFVYWEVTILMRKALFSVVVIFAYPLGSNLQGIMALGILFVSLAFHLIAMPFKFLPLNILEALSLTVSFFAFYCGIAFNDENTSDIVKLVFSVIMISVTLVLVVIFVATICFYSDMYVTAKLKFLGRTNIPNNPLSKWFHLVVMTTGQMNDALKGYLQKCNT